MASRDGDAPPARNATAIDLTSDSGSSHAGSDDSQDHSNIAVCPWRTDRYNVGECSRYWDCPTHTARRTSDGGDSEDENAHDEDEDAEMEAADESAALDHNEDEGEGVDSSPSPILSRMPRVSLEQDLLAGGETTARRSRSDNTVFSAHDFTSAMPDPRHVRRRSSTAQDDDDEEEEDDGGTVSPLDRTGYRQRSRPALGTQENPISVDSPSAAARFAHRHPTAMLSQPNTAPAPDERPGPTEIVLPRWQPDAEVTYCPICNTQFSIFVRKHHCRKCGRVVCNACSPHRITIPYQFIVQPPGTPRVLAQRYPSSLVSGAGGYADFSSLGGGERVRLCNPCVPDPNTAPPQDQSALRTHSRSRSTVNQPYPAASLDANNVFQFLGTASSADGPAGSRRATMSGNMPAGPSGRTNSNPYMPTSAHSRILFGTPPAYTPPAPSSSFSSSTQRPSLYPGMAPRHRPLIPPRPGGGFLPEFNAALANRRLPPLPGMGPYPGAPRPQFQPQPRPLIAEEDECPVCHRELPPRTLPNFEAQREAHINICIQTHSTYGSIPTSSDPSAPAGQAAGSPSMPVPPRRTGMFPYSATEKDCVDSAECTICMEEFEVGVAMARLECLCRFHRDCIKRWWERSPGRCPMHQHDSFGY